MRGDRKPGLAARQAPFVHADKAYDFQVDTTDCGADQCADEIARWFNRPLGVRDQYGLPPFPVTVITPLSTRSV